ncbi:alanine dehydrogenase [Facklamia miroungae]|uniref:Alanine dehydrogenase n=1 Tax=Facklamia miroungae TaxID=120956 RepID=A0A1G7QX04_9LACT|nr:alanine dehydrogenase [Facklamia miroungae]NKZ29096.1 alanine dehydrogenase [Facklamia miroungae]SDG03056.1 alanine dehydrogenase [Facklamia miroungae]
MIIGIPKELKANEDRVGLTPNNVKELITAGHEVMVEEKAGLGSGFTDQEYVEAGARIVTSAKETWEAEMVIKVKEPVKEEYQYFYEGLILFTYLHLAPELELTQALLDKGVIGVAYETVADKGTLPLLTPMSEVAGRMAVQIGARLLEKNQGGPGILFGGVPGVRRANVTVIGGGVVGFNTAKLAYGLGANVTILDINPQRLAEIENILGNGVQTLMSNEANIHKAVVDSDVVVGSVLLAGRRAPVLVKEETIQQMRSGSVLIDIAVDQGGNFETTRPTTHKDPIFLKHDVIHYAVANIPGAVPRTSTIALTNATLQYAKEIANAGIEGAAKQNDAILSGINTYFGNLTSIAVAESQDRAFVDIQTVF